MKRLIAWLIENYYADDWMSQADHAESLKKHENDVILTRFAARRDIARLEATVTRLTRERDSLLTEGLHRFALLPKTASRKGTLDTKLEIVRQPFSIAVTYTLSDEEARPMGGPLRLVVIEQLAMLLIEKLKADLNQELQYEKPE